MEETAEDDPRSSKEMLEKLSDLIGEDRKQRSNEVCIKIRTENTTE